MTIMTFENFNSNQLITQAENYSILSHTQNCKQHVDGVFFKPTSVFLFISNNFEGKLKKRFNRLILTEFDLLADHAMPEQACQYK